MRHTIRERGFTLIEVLAAIALITFALIPIMIIVPQMIENSLKTERLTRVIFLGEHKIEEVKRETTNNFSASQNESATDFASAYPDDEDYADYTEYKYLVSDDGGSEIKVIQVRVWHDEDGDDALDSTEQSITLDTKIADRE